MNLYIFDFDGTIADTFPIFAGLLKVHHRLLGIRNLGDADEAEFKKMTSRELMKFFSLPSRDIPRFLVEARKLLNTEIDRINIVPEISKVLSELSKDNTLLILTSNSSDNVDLFCKRHGINYFKQICTEQSFFGKGNEIRKILKNIPEEYTNIFYIGDETRDITAARINKIKSVAVTWGYADREVLERYRPDYLIDSPEELLNIPG